MRDGPGRDINVRLAEATGLAEALALEVAGADRVRIRRPHPATLFGVGTVRRFNERFARADASLVIVDAALAPVQQRNLERAWKRKVLDRSGLILEIFGKRARSAEGRIQVEHAHLTYQKSRLVRSWTHLERQRGGFGFLGGPGETQIEADRRMIATRLRKLDAEIERICRSHHLQRGRRRRSATPTVALVGYTNAGKSSLFNRLCGAGVVARSIPFATLDPTVRRLRLPNGVRATLSDTVGFITDLPTELVAAFRATLDEVVGAELILHVVDATSPERELHRTVVRETLEKIGVRRDHPLIEAHNKVDLLSAVECRALGKALARKDSATAVSARTGEGITQLLAAIQCQLGKGRVQHTFCLAPDSGAALAWLHQRGAVAGETAGRQPLAVVASLDEGELGEFRRRFATRIMNAGAPAPGA